MKNELQIVTISCFPARQKKPNWLNCGAQKANRLIMIEQQPLSSDEKLREKWKFSQFRLTLKHFHVVREPISVRTIQSSFWERDASDARQKFVDASICRGKNVLVIPGIFMSVLLFFPWKIELFLLEMDIVSVRGVARKGVVLFF